MATTTGTSRRAFLERAGGLIIGFSTAGPALVSSLSAAPEGFPTPAPERLDSWLRIGADGMVNVFTDKVDIGMGLQTALSQIVAEELDVTPARVAFIAGDTGKTPDQGGVGGSTSIPFGSKPLRNASATARYLLVQSASRKLGAPAEQLQVKDGVVSVIGDESKNVAYGALVSDTDLNEALTVSGRAFNVNVEGKGKPKDPATYKVVGQPIPRPDLAEKILGKATYAPDVRVPGMLHGRVVRPAGIGASVVSVDDSAAKKIPGYVKTVVKGNFVAVVAESEWGAIKASRDLKVNWSAPAVSLPDDLYAHIRTATPRATKDGLKKGDAAAALQGAAKKVEASYEWPYQAHATMGPGCAVADVHMDGVTTVWCGSQKVHALHRGLAELLKVPPERVRVIWTQDAGSYGRAGFEDAAADAVLLSQAVGKPVRVQWMRSDMTAWGSKGPATVVDLKAGLDANGTVQALEFTSRTFSGAEVSYLPDHASNFLAAQLMGMTDTTADEFVQLGDAAPAYEIPNVHAIGHVMPALHAQASPLNATHLRDPNGPAATFAMESFMDELAAATGSDAVEFRLKHLKSDRAQGVIIAAVEKAKWEKRVSGSHVGTAEVLVGRGIAYSERGGTHVATIAEVEVNRRSGAVKVKRLVCAHDCGLIVNPDGVKGVVAANLMQSLGRTLKEEVTFDRGKVTSTDWNSYPVVRAMDVPEHVEIVLVNRPDVPSTGAGEPSTRPTAAAIANAVFDATGKRLRRAPLTPARVKAAMTA